MERWEKKRQRSAQGIKKRLESNGKIRKERLRINWKIGKEGRKGVWKRRKGVWKRRKGVWKRRKKIIQVGEKGGPLVAKIGEEGIEGIDKLHLSCN